MYSTAQMNGQHQQVGLPSSRSSQTASLLTHNTVWNQQTGKANSSCQYMAANMGVPPPQTRSSFTFQDGAHCNREMLNWQTSAAPYQPASLHQSNGEKKDGFMNILLSNCQNSTNMQSGNPSLQVSNATKHNFYPNSAQNPKPNMMFTSATQNRATHWSQSASIWQKQSMRTQDGNIMSDLQPPRALRRLRPKPHAVHVKTATSLQRKHTACTSTLVSSTAHNSRSVHNQNRRHATQHGFYFFTSPPTYSAAVSRVKNKSTTTNSSSGQIRHRSRMAQQYLLLYNFQTVHPKDPAADAQHQTHSYTEAQEIARIADSLRESYTTGSDDCHPVHTSSPCKGEQMAENRVKECNQTVQPVTSADANGCNPDITQNVMSKSYHNVNVSLQQSSVTHVAYVLTPGVMSGTVHGAGSASLPQNGNAAKGSSNDPFELARLMLMDKSPPCQRSQMQSSAANNGEKPEMLSSVTCNNIHLSPGCTGTRAVAVVQPLSQESTQGDKKNAFSNTTRQPDECTPTDTFLSNPQKLSSLSMQADPCVPSAAQKSVTSEVPESQIGNTDKTEITTDPKAHVFDLSPVPTTPWTYNSLIKLIKESEKSQMALEENDSLNKIFSMFWDSEVKNLANKLKSGWYRDLINSVREFCRDFLTPDSVILSQVTQSPEKQPESYRTLKDNETYSELPYSSSWLNVNKQLDDIDKEFGYPMSWTFCLNMLKSLCQPDEVGTVNSVPVQIASDVPNKVLSHTEVESVDSGEEKQASTPEAISPQTSSPCKTEGDDSSDPYYSFQIQVLPPEEAKIIFQQSEMPQITDVDSQPKEVMKSSVEAELPNVRTCDLNVICCIEKWLKKFDGSSQIECKCNGEQRDKGCAEMEAATAPKNDNLSVIRSDSKSLSPIVGWVQQGDIDIPVTTYSGAGLCNDVRPPIGPIEDGEKPDSQNISHISINDSQSSIILLSESEDENQPSSEIPTQISDSGDPTLDPDKECSQDHLKSAESGQSSSSDNGMKEIQKDFNSEAVSHMLAHEEDCAQAQLTSTDSLMEVDEQTEISVTDAPQQQTKFSVTQKHENVQLKKKTPSTTDQIFPFLKNAKKPRPSEDMGTQTVFNDVNFKKDFVDAAHGEASAKQSIYEKWWRNYPLTKIKDRRKLTTKKSTSASSSAGNLRKAETVAPITNNKELPGARERRICNRSTKCRLRMKRKRSFSNRLRHGEEKKIKHDLTVDHGRSAAEKESCAVKPLLKNIPRFSVLPNTFSFVDGSNKRKETTDNLSDDSDFESKDKDVVVTVSKTKVTWCSLPKEKFRPRRTATDQKASIVFQEFQRKYRKMIQPSTAK